MAQVSYFWTTSGTGDGSASGYTQDNITQIYRALFAGLSGADLSGIAPDYMNRLAVSGTSSPVVVATGAALAYGFFFHSSASENVVVPTPSTLTRIDRIVLEANWSAQTVRIARVAGSEGGAAPSLTQTAATTWQMPLAQASITTGGVITLTDQREWLGLIGDGAVTTAKIGDLQVTAAKLAADVKIGPTVMYIPIVAYMGNPGSGGSINVASASYLEVYPQIEITKEHFPSTCTVKLVALVSAGTTNLKSIDLYNKTASATVTGSEVTSTSNAGIIQLKSGDFRANLTAGANRYTARMKKAAGSISVYAIYLLVEW